MLAAFVQGPVLRLVMVGLIVVALQQTLFVDLRPGGVTVQVVLALAAAAGAGGGPQKGALAGFVLGVMFDLRVGTPVGTSSITMGVAGFTAGYVQSITVDPQWWLSSLFVGLGTAIGEGLRPVVRRFVGDQQEYTLRIITVVVVVTAGALVMSPVLLPIGRWCMKVKRTDWTKVASRAESATTRSAPP
ncbi:hypothetical protein BH24ACT5_BH24ACT5_02500 [soil metagenome]